METNSTTTFTLVAVCNTHVHVPSIYTPRKIVTPFKSKFDDDVDTVIMKRYLGENWKLVEGDEADEDINYRRPSYLKCIFKWMPKEWMPTEWSTNFEREFPNYNCVGYFVGGKGHFLSILHKPINKPINAYNLLHELPLD